MKLSLKDRIEKLQTKGYEVEIKHYREFGGFVPSGDESGNIPKGWNKLPAPKGGETIATIKKDGLVISASAKCSIEDNYNKKIGGSIALGRAQKLLNE